MSNTAQHTPAYVVKYTAIGNPIPDEMNPTYNSGYETTEHCEIIRGTEDEILERFAGTDTENLQIIGPITSPDLLKENEELNARLASEIKIYDAVIAEKNKKLQAFESLNSKLLEALKAAYPVLIEAREKWSNGEDAYSSAEALIIAAIAKAEGRTEK